jgi:hypothetical protein
MCGLSNASQSMARRCFTLVYCLAAWAGNGQNTPARAQASSLPDENRSFYAGTPVTHPEELSGIWEAPDGHGGAIGIHLLLSTTAPADVITLVGAKQLWSGLTVGIYQRSGPVLQVGEGNYFGDSPRGGGVRYASDRLTLRAPGFDLDLRHNSRNEWTGRFHRKGFDSEVTLTRPGKRKSRKDAWLEGSWLEGRSGPSQTCLHIVETAPGQFIGWSDTLLAWGTMIFAPNVPKPPYSLESYGDLAKVSATVNGGVSVELNAYTPICCSRLVAIIPAKNGTVMAANGKVGPNQAPQKSEWKKMPGKSCIASER